MSSRQITRGETRLQIVAETYATASGERESDVLDGRNTARLPMRLGSTYARAEMGAACPRTSLSVGSALGQEVGEFVSNGFGLSDHEVAA